MAMQTVLDWIITVVFTGFGAVLAYAFHRINSLKNEQSAHETQTAKEIGDLVSSVELEQVKTEMNKYQQETNVKLGEYIRREEMNTVLDRYEQRIERQFTELKELVKSLIIRT